MGFFEGSDQGCAVGAGCADHGAGGFVVNVYRAQDLQPGAGGEDGAEVGDEVGDGLGRAGEFGQFGCRGEAGSSAVFDLAGGKAFRPGPSLAPSFFNSATVLSCGTGSWPKTFLPNA